MICLVKFSNLILKKHTKKLFSMRFLSTILISHHKCTKAPMVLTAQLLGVNFNPMQNIFGMKLK